MAAIGSVGQPIFVADNPRRGVYARWIARIAAATAALYLIVTAAGLLGAPWVPHISLPGVGPVTVNQVPGKVDSLGSAQDLPAPDVSRIVLETTGTHLPEAVAGSSEAGWRPFPAGEGVDAPGNSENAPGRAGTADTETAPGKSGTAPGQSGTTPSDADTTPGKSGTTPGHSGTAPARSRDGSGNSGTTPGRSSSGASRSGDAPGRPGDAPGQSASGSSRSNNGQGQSASSGSRNPR